VAGLTFWLIGFTAMPARRQLLYGHFLTMATHAGRWGGSAAGAPGWEEIRRNAVEAWNEDPLAAKEVALALAVTLGQLALSLRWKSPARRRSMFLAFLLVLLNVAAVLKQPGTHYLVPCLAVFPALLAGFWKAEPSRWLRILPALTVAAFFVGHWPDYHAYISNLRITRATLGDWEAYSDAEIEAHRSCLTVLPSTGTSRIWANSSAQAFTGDVFTAELEALYPHTWFSDYQEKPFYNFAGRASLEELRKQLPRYPCLLLVTRKDLPLHVMEALLPRKAWKVLRSTPQADMLWADLSFLRPR
jgi:hypothetical protein